MRVVFAAFGVAVALATITGCASSQPKAAQGSDDVVRSMRAELSKTVDSAELAVSTTSLTNAALLVSEPALPPMMLPESRMSLNIPEQAETEPTPVPTAEDGSPMFMLDDELIVPTQTWGIATKLDLTEIPDTRE